MPDLNGENDQFEKRYLLNSNRFQSKTIETESKLIGSEYKIGNSNKNS